jgi:phytoene dehydrogenase-like protein
MVKKNSRNGIRDGIKDVVIIGSGIGGLSAAIILLKLGYNVRVIEKNRRPGGLMRSYTRHGIHCPVGLHYIGAMGNRQPLRRIFDYLGVSTSLPMERMGIDGPIDKYIFPDFSFDLPSGIDAFEENLRAQFPGNNKQITILMDGIRRVARMMLSFDFPFNTGNDYSIAGTELFIKNAKHTGGSMLMDRDPSKRLPCNLSSQCSFILFVIILEIAMQRGGYGGCVCFQDQ